MRNRSPGIRFARVLAAGACLVLTAAASEAADLANGRSLYAVHCASCHGASGVSLMPMAPNFARNEKLFQPDAMLVAAIRTGRNAMPGYAGILTEREMYDVVAYLRALRP